ncbi:hypothetical protein G7K_2332-t1 [Saitoella complicata NRRL Y-17804]|uniref:Uncharacterized protein n=1 Tax=Saitoella complicata (strain BCRC 22490 / CBS 7301 / JCM 7358 / NBRC 10748 / NRRL Y-17804) TaxID=698492 RepID=A0A0E9NFG3_SAICN|nr:hypothetical protein G7K_2332-t1 [Saitoella complicata NRRL Y-17804]
MDFKAVHAMPASPKRPKKTPFTRTRTYRIVSYRYRYQSQRSLQSKRKNDHPKTLALINYYSTQRFP